MDAQKESSDSMKCPLCESEAQCEVHDDGEVLYMKCPVCGSFGISKIAISHLTETTKKILSAETQAAETATHVLEISYQAGFQKAVVPRYRR
jgi:hypothetical protein